MEEKNWAVRLVVLFLFATAYWGVIWFSSDQEFRAVHECECQSIEILRMRSTAELFASRSGLVILGTIVIGALVMFIPPLTVRSQAALPANLPDPVQHYPPEKDPDLPPAPPPAPSPGASVMLGPALRAGHEHAGAMETPLLAHPLSDSTSGAGGRAARPSGSGTHVPGINGDPGRAGAMEAPPPSAAPLPRPQVEQTWTPHRQAVAKRRQKILLAAVIGSTIFLILLYWLTSVH